MDTTGTPQGTSDQPVLVAYDDSPGARRALATAADLAARTGSALRIQFAQGPVPAEPNATPALRQAVADLLQGAVDSVAETHPGLDVDTRSTWTAPRGAIIEASEEALVTVVGRRGHGPLKSLLLGSVSGAVAAHAHSPVLVVPDAAHAPDDHADGPVVVGIDGSDESLHAADVALRLAGGRPVVLLLAWQPLAAMHAALGPYGGVIVTDPEVDEAEYTRLLDDCVRRVTETHPDATVEGRLVRQDPASALRVASEQASLVVVATRGHGGFSGMLLGSVAQAVIQTSACPVLVTRGKGEAPA